MLNPVFRFAWPLIGVIAVLALLVLPWTNQRIEDLKNQYESRGDLERIEPGQFQESSDGSRVFFVEKNELSASSGSNVFIATTDSSKKTMTSARGGRIETLNDGRYLLLSNGQRSETQTLSNELKISEFKEYGTRVRDDTKYTHNHLPVNTLSTINLIKLHDLQSLGELSWRFGIIFSSINLIIIGVALSSTKPRNHKSLNITFSIFTFIIYFNFMNVGQNWIASGRINFLQFTTTLHCVALIIAIFLLSKNHFNWQPMRFFVK